jgi:hypothetical protein
MPSLRWLRGPSLKIQYYTKILKILQYKYSILRTLLRMHAWSAYTGARAEQDGVHRWCAQSAGRLSRAGPDR